MYQAFESSKKPKRWRKKKEKKKTAGLGPLRTEFSSPDVHSQKETGLKRGSAVDSRQFI